MLRLRFVMYVSPPRVSLSHLFLSLSLLSFSFSFYLVLMLFAYVSFFLCDFNLKRCRFFSNSFFVKANFELALYRSHSFLSAVWARSGKGNLNNTLDIMTDASSEGKMKKRDEEEQGERRRRKMPIICMSSISSRTQTRLSSFLSLYTFLAFYLKFFVFSFFVWAENVEMLFLLFCFSCKAYENRSQAFLVLNRSIHLFNISFYI